MKKNNIKYRDDYVHAEDRPFYGDILNAGGKMSNVPEVLLDYRVHTTNPSEYYQKQSASELDYHLSYLNRIIPVKGLSEYYDKCQLLKKLREYAENNDFVDLHAIEDMQKKYDCSEKQVFVED